MFHKFLEKNSFKGSVDIILNDPPCWRSVSDSQQYPLNLWLRNDDGPSKETKNLVSSKYKYFPFKSRWKFIVVQIISSSYYTVLPFNGNFYFRDKNTEFSALPDQ